MKLLALNCNQCGAPLEVPAKAKFVTCNFCSTRLSVQRTDKVAYTEAIEEIQERTRQMSEDLKALKKRSDLDDLNRSWRRRREKFMTRSKNGVLSVPQKHEAISMGVGAVLAGSLWMTYAMRIGFGGIFPLFGLVFIGVGLYGSMRMIKKADEFHLGHQAYLSERSKLLG